MPTLAVPEPGYWASLTNVTLRADGMLLYEYGPTQSTRPQGRWRTDDRSRTAVEAFSALRLEVLAAAIEERAARLRDQGRPVADTWDLPMGHELRSFLLTFGPVLVGYGARFPVRNSAAERWEARATAAESELVVLRRGGHPEQQRRQPRLRPWVASFEGSPQGS